MQTMRSGGLSIEFQIEGHEAGFSKAVLMTLFRAAQEGLTNIQMHARADCAILQVHLNETSAMLSLSDNGCGFDPGVFMQWRRTSAIALDCAIRAASIGAFAGRHLFDPGDKRGPLHAGFTLIE